MPAPAFSFDQYLQYAPPTVILKPDAPVFTIVTANEAYLKATGTCMSDLEGKGLFEAFPVDPQSTQWKSEEGLRFNLQECVQQKRLSTIPAQRYDIPVRGSNEYDARMWQVNSVPVLNDQAEVEYIVHSATDISGAFNLAKEERIALKVIQEQRRLLKNSFQQAPVGIAILRGRELVIDIANDMVLALWGKNQQVVGKPLSVALPELQGQPFLQLLDDVYTTGIAYHGTETLAQLEHAGELKTLYFNFAYQPITDENGVVNSVMVIATDVSEHVANRRQVEESELRLRNLVMNAHYSLLILQGPEWVIQIANQSLADLWSKPLEEILGRPLMQVLPELESQPFPSLLRQVYETGKSYGQEEEVFYYNTPKGRVTKYVSFYYDPMYDSKGEVSGIIVSAEDITTRVEDRQAKDRAQEMLRLAVQSAELGTWYIDAETRKLIPSVRLKELFGYGPNEVMPYDAAVAQITDEYRDFVIEAVENAIVKGEAFDLEYPIIGYNDGKLRWVKATGKLYNWSEDEPAHFSGTLLDITERKMDEQRKNDFVAMVSHELKTPLTSAKAYIQMLNAKSRKNQDQFAANALDKVELQVNRMQTLIKGFLDVARLEAGKIYLNIQPFKLNNLLQEAVDEALLLSQSHLIIFHPCEDITIEADKDKIAQVVNNFLSNAVKYSPKGRRIEVTCAHTKTEARVSVKDEGMGIKPQDVERLFTRFYRVENQHTQTISGFGIGLYLCDEIIQRHNGKIWVESEVGKGSVFNFSLPVTASIE